MEAVHGQWGDCLMSNCQCGFSGAALQEKVGKGDNLLMYIYCCNLKMQELFLFNQPLSVQKLSTMGCL